jgi:hypothetical protein
LEEHRTADPADRSVAAEDTQRACTPVDLAGETGPAAAAEGAAPVRMAPHTWAASRLGVDQQSSRAEKPALARTQLNGRPATAQAWESGDASPPLGTQP